MLIQTLKLNIMYHKNIEMVNIMKEVSHDFIIDTCLNDIIFKSFIKKIEKSQKVRLSHSLS